MTEVSEGYELTPNVAEVIATYAWEEGISRRTMTLKIEDRIYLALVEWDSARPEEARMVAAFDVPEEAS